MELRVEYVLQAHVSGSYLSTYAHGRLDPIVTPTDVTSFYQRLDLWQKINQGRLTIDRKLDVST